MHPFYGHILQRLHRCKRVGKKGDWIACCPAHEDRHPSLLLFIGKRGELVARCLSNKGCTWAKIAAAIDTKVQDWWPPNDEQDDEWKRRRMVKPEIERVYEYHDEHGQMLYQCVRYKRPHQPRFRQRRPDGVGGWIWSLDDVQHVLYRLPELLARPNQPVLVVEGEKDADALRSLGFVATTGPCGASAWRTDYARWLRGRRVVILPDNDEPGERYARDVAGSCLLHGSASIRVVRLIGLPDGGDVSDWLDDALPNVTADMKKQSLIENILNQAEYRSTAFYPPEECR